MKKVTIILAIAVIVIASWIAAFSFMFFRRYPSDSEIRDHLSPEIAGRVVIIDRDQAEVGLFGIRIEGEEDYFIEATQKWVFPWDSYYEASP